MYPNATCELNFTTPFELLVAVILSAQCTDKRVNMVTEKLFKVLKKPTDFADVDEGVLEEYIHPCGFYRSKAKSLKEASQSILENFNGEVPDNVEDLMKLRGVGRKTANVVYSTAFGGNAIAVDTHVFRVSNRLGLVNASTPEKTELMLMEVLPENEWTKMHQRLVLHGRYCCKAKKPECFRCGLNQVCKYYLEKQIEKK